MEKKKKSKKMNRRSHDERNESIEHQLLMYQNKDQLEASGFLDKWRRQQALATAPESASDAATPTFPKMSSPTSRTSRLEICWTCQGLRIQKVPYGHMILERTCEACDGEGVILKNQEPTLVSKSSTRSA